MNDATPFIQRLKNVRLGYAMDMPSKPLNTTWFKTLSGGGEKVVSRPLSATNTYNLYMDARFSYSVTVHQSLLRRIRKIPFTTRFMTAPKRLDEQKLDIYLLGKVEKSNTMHRKFMFVLIQNLEPIYRNLNECSLNHPPQSCFTMEELKVVDIDRKFLNFCKEEIVYCSQSYISFSDILDSFIPDHGYSKSSPEYRNFYKTASIYFVTLARSHPSVAYIKMYVRNKTKKWVWNDITSKRNIIIPGINQDNREDVPEENDVDSTESFIFMYPPTRNMGCFQNLTDFSSICPTEMADEKVISNRKLTSNLMQD
ncbi:hypothetical protein RF11_05583 [Thelohanellus kitauei]|uniref:Uncharacterized protein n=1 Tax=Thelohanellus kitauei TaxID=669202 RepID=A0A0C2M815_THEKT|nr:hypothetical protein RF11_05583 [Thelohanellus kitauei]